MRIAVRVKQVPAATGGRPDGFRLAAGSSTILRTAVGYAVLAAGLVAVAVLTMHRATTAS